MATLAAFFGNYDALEIAFEQGMDLMSTLDGTTLLDLTKNSNVFIPVIFKKILQDPNFTFDSQEDDYFKVILDTDLIEVRDVVSNLITDARFSFRSQLSDKGIIMFEKTFFERIGLIKPQDLTKIFDNSKIQEKMILTDQRLISEKVFKTHVHQDKKSMNEIVIFKTLRVPLFLQNGHPKFLKLLADIIFHMPSESVEQ